MSMKNKMKKKWMNGDEKEKERTIVEQFRHDDFK
jgi:hypothetical protein